jgi:hypothetical protein
MPPGVTSRTAIFVETTGLSSSRNTGKSREGLVEGSQENKEVSAGRNRQTHVRKRQRTRGRNSSSHKSAEPIDNDQSRSEGFFCTTVFSREID